tara:strand:- start:115 stop:435 length:321 start_codon:yes stop_codon:yes gene_type:complete
VSLRVVLCTAPETEAADLARELVTRRLAACCNIVPGLRSIYRWKGELCDDGEALLLIKTRADRVAELSAALVELHPYDCPEVIALPLEEGEGNPAYLQWLMDESSP